MIFKSENKDKQVIIVDCDCGCNAEMHITKHKDDDINHEEFYLSLHSSKWDEEQLGFSSILCRRMRRAFYNLIGKDYLYMDVVISKPDFIQFANNITEMTKK